MEEKYDPLQIVSHVWGKFRALPEHLDSQVEDYSIFIKIKQSENEYYLIRSSKYGHLWKGILSGTDWRMITDTEELSENKDLLGTVHIKFRNNPIRINNKPLEPFPNYDFFWNYITRQNEGVIMGEKYDPLHIVSHVWRSFDTLPEHENSKIEDYSIYIEIEKSKNECYLVKAGEDAFLWKGVYGETTWEAIKDEEELYKKRDLLGSVHIRFKEKPIEINERLLDPFPDYDFFWSYITS